MTVDARICKCSSGEESAEETVASVWFASTVNAVELGHGKRAKRNVTSMWPRLVTSN